MSRVGLDTKRHSEIHIPDTVILVFTFMQFAEIPHLSIFVCPVLDIYTHSTGDEVSILHR